MVKCLNIGKNIGKPIYRSISNFNTTSPMFPQESYRQVMKMRPKDLWKRLMVKFRAEEGLDYGGVARYEFDTT